MNKNRRIVVCSKRGRELKSIGNMLNKLQSADYVTVGFSEAKLFWNEVQKDAGQFFNPIESALKAINEKPFQDETEKNIGRSLKQLPSELRKIQIGDFEIFLNSIGFKTEITEISKGWVDGIITLKNAHIDCIAKYTSTFSAKLVFVIETEAKKVDGINLEIKQKDGKILNLYWASKNKALAAALNNDADLMQKLANGIQKNNSSKWNSSSSTSTVNSDGKEIQKHYVVLSHTLKNLPSKDYFEAINKVAYHIRQVN